MRNTANTSSAAALIPSMAELSKIGDRHSSDSEPVGLNDSERAMSIDDGSRSNQLSGMVSRRTALTSRGHESRTAGTNRFRHNSLQPYSCSVSRYPCEFCRWQSAPAMVQSGTVIR